MVNVTVAVYVEDVRAFAALHKQRIAADALKSADRRVDAAGDDALGFGKEPGGLA